MSDNVHSGFHDHAQQDVTMAGLERLTRREAADYLRDRWRMQAGVSLLSRFAHEGGGPAYYRSGRRSLYDVADLDAWAQERLGTKATTHREHRSLAAEAAAGPA